MVGNLLGAEDELLFEGGIFLEEFPGAFGTREGCAARSDELVCADEFKDRFLDDFGEEAYRFLLGIPRHCREDCVRNVADTALVGEIFGQASLFLFVV